MKKCLLMFAVLAGAGLLHAENLIKDAAADWDNVVEVEKNGAKWLETTSTKVVNKTMVEVDVNAKYRLSGKVLLGDPAPKSGVLIGLAPLCGNKEPIRIWHVNNIPKTDTELVADYKAGDTVLKVKDATNWKVHKYMVIALGADDSGELNDLPNRNLIMGGIANLEQKDGEWLVTLNKPCDKDIAKGTKVRLHSYGGHYIYMVSIKTKDLSDSEPKEFSAEVSGEAKRGGSNLNFWRGTKYVNVIVMPLGGRGKVLFSDIKLEKVE